MVAGALLRLPVLGLSAPRRQTSHARREARAKPCGGRRSRAPATTHRRQRRSPLTPGNASRSCLCREGRRRRASWCDAKRAGFRIGVCAGGGGGAPSAPTSAGPCARRAWDGRVRGAQGPRTREAQRGGPATTSPPRTTSPGPQACFIAAARIRDVDGRMMRGSTSRPSSSAFRTSFPEMATGFSLGWLSVRSTRPADS